MTSNQATRSDPPGDDYDTALSKWLPQPAAPEANGEDADDGLLGGDLLGSPMSGTNKSPEHLAALGRVGDWVRERFKLGDDDVISVAEIACNLPGCPPLESVVTFWTENGEKRHHFKMFKRIEEVSQDNLPYAWLKDTLVVPEGFGCDCC